MLHTRFNINTMWLQFRALLAHIQCLVVSRSKIRKYVCKLLLEMQIYNHRIVRCVCERINTFNTHTMWRVGWENTGNLSVARWRPRHGSCQFKADTHTHTPPEVRLTRWTCRTEAFPSDWFEECVLKRVCAFSTSALGTLRGSRNNTQHVCDDRIIGCVCTPGLSLANSSDSYNT